MAITYEIGSSLYFNITNKCPCKCTFCVRKTTAGVNYGESLWLEHEPALEEILEDLSERDLKKYSEFVFCGFGEPTERLDILLKCAEFLNDHKKERQKIRLNTNGLSDLINNKETAPLFDRCIDILSISLNAPDSETYNALCSPVFGESSFDAIIRFASDSKRYIPEVVMSVVGASLDKEAVERCRDLCGSLGISLRVR